MKKTYVERLVPTHLPRIIAMTLVPVLVLTPVSGRKSVALMRKGQCATRTVLIGGQALALPAGHSEIPAWVRLLNRPARPFFWPHYGLAVALAIVPQVLRGQEPPRQDKSGTISVMELADPSKLEMSQRRSYLQTLANVHLALRSDDLAGVRLKLGRLGWINLTSLDTPTLLSLREANAKALTEVMQMIVKAEGYRALEKLCRPFQIKPSALGIQDPAKEKNKRKPRLPPRQGLLREQA